MKRIKHVVFIIVLVFNSLIASSQPLSQKVLLTINDNPVTVEEFKSIYLKNNTSNATFDRTTLEDYLKLFINFKLKVQEAKNAKIDTSSTFITEYQGYIKQLAQPYLTDSTSDEQLLNEAYERMLYEVSASHILINVPENSTPTDTLKFYNKALDARNRVLKGEPFGTVALSTSNDPSVSRNNGLLGYFTAFQMVYPFETAAYNTPIDSISMPVRTRFGYHIIKVHGKRPAQGQVKAAHILLRVKPNSNPLNAEGPRKRIEEIYEKVKNGEDFAVLARQFSEDPGSAKNGGEMPWLSSGQIIPEFERVAFGLNADGQVSEPFQSSFGWHIVKRIGRKTVGSKEAMLTEIKTLVAKDSRNLKSRESFINKLKKEYNLKEDSSNLNILKPLLDSTIYKGTWRAPLFKNNATLFSFTGGTYKLSDFAGFIESNQKFIGKSTIQNFLSIAYNEWLNRNILEFEESKLSEKHPEFKQLSKEYFEGMLLFEISNSMVWNKSSDSTGISIFYDSRKDEYKWGERVHYAIYTIKDAKLKDKFIGGIAKRKNKNITPKEYIAKFNKDINPIVFVEEKSANSDFEDVINYKTWEKGIKITPNNDGHLIVVEILKVTNGDIKKFDECRGQVVADYQEKLEEEWLETLKAKFTVNIYNDVFAELIESISKK